MPKVTICTPMKNASDTIRSTALSVLKQNFEDWKWLVLDNGSDDFSQEQLISTFEKHKLTDKLVVFENSKFSLPEARDFLVKQSDSEFIAILDADDLFHPERLKRALWVMQGEPDMALCGSAATWFIRRKFGDREFDKTIKEFRPPKFQYPRFDKFGIVHATVTHSSFVYRKADYERIGGYRKFHTVTHDHDLMLRLSNIGNIYCDQQSYVKYLLHDGAISSQKRMEQVKNCITSYANLLLRRIGENELEKIIPENEVFSFIDNIGRRREAKVLQNFYKTYIENMSKKRY